MTIDKYFNKVKSLCHENFKLDPTAAISESRIKRIIVHGLRPEFESFIIDIKGWPTQPTIKEFKHLLVDQEVIDEQKVWPQ